MFDLFGSPNQFDYVNLKYVPSQIFFTHTIKDLWRHKPWEVETQTLGIKSMQLVRTKNRLNYSTFRLISLVFVKTMSCLH